MVLYCCFSEYGTLVREEIVRVHGFLTEKVIEGVLELPGEWSGEGSGDYQHGCWDVNYGVG